MKGKADSGGAANGGAGFCVGAVRYFNARPLIFHLEQRAGLRLRREAPARLAAALDAGAVQAALAPAVDYQRPERDWRILPFGAIGSCGQVLTVQVFSRQEMASVERLACDGDSHTSVVLAQVIWHLRYGRRLEVAPLAGNVEDAPAVLLIGDKVLGQLNRWPCQLDLGQAWTELTGLPFVYAFWAVPAGAQCAELAQILEHTCREGLAHIDAVVREYASGHGFEPELAQTYLSKNVCYHFGPRQRQGLSRFFDLAYELGLIPCRKPLRFYPPPGKTIAAAANGQQDRQRWQTPSA